MTELFTEKYALLWAVALAVALFFPVRKMIWVLSVRRAERDGRQDESRRRALGRRASMTAGFLVLVFSYFYTRVMFKG
ncbi:MAG: hypothetical protein ACE5GS_08310 [Kiloniellaceae bacterium]